MLLNSIQARKIFDKYSFLLGAQDVVDAICIGDLFGNESVIHAIKNYSEKEKTFTKLNFSNGRSRFYLTYEGFCEAITYCNEQEIIQNDKALFGEGPSLKDGKQQVEDRNVICLKEWRQQGEKGNRNESKEAITCCPLERKEHHKSNRILC